MLIGPCRKSAAIDTLDADLQNALILARANRIGPAQFDAIEIAAERQILALCEIESRRIAIDRLQRHDDSVARFTTDIRHLKGMKTRHGRSLPHRSDAFEIVEGFKTIETAPACLARR